MRLEVVPLHGLPEVRPGDDLAAILAPRAHAARIRGGDVLVVTSKVVSKAEGMLVAGTDRSAAIEAQTRRVVARRGDLVIAETAHGLVCANAGVDASNVEAGTLALLPKDPDASAQALRGALSDTLGVRIGVVITDTFGRPWRNGLVNVAIGCAGLPAIIDLRGTPDQFGRELETTVVGLADEVAAASGLVMAKAARVPAAIVRGVDQAGVPDGVARDLIRPQAEDLFRESPLQALHAHRTVRSFTSGDVPPEAIEEAIAVACAAPALHDAGPWRFTALTSAVARKALVVGAGDGDGSEDDVALAAAPVLVVPWSRLAGREARRDDASARAERQLSLLSGGAMVQTLMLALRAQGVASFWSPATLRRQETTRAALGVEDTWSALGTVACGHASGTATGEDRSIDLGKLLEWR